MAGVRLQAVDKTYADGARVLRGLDLTVADGELLVLVGPSGSGKSTALRIVAGLESPSAGRVFIGDDDVTEWPPQARDVAMVFQSYALYPHMSVRENLAFGMRLRGVSGPEIARRTQDMAERLSLGQLLERRPAQLSGGQRQRVALGRALVREPRVFLLDEPLSNLDAKLRIETRAEIGRLHVAFGVTTVYVTHDQEEAMTLGDRIAVLGENGVLAQLGTPREIYGHPETTFVADFVGLPRINWFEGEIEGVELVCPDFGLKLPGPPRPRTRVRIGIRPHDLAPAPSAGPLRGRVELIEALGPALLVHACSDRGAAFRLLLPADAAVRRGEPIRAAPDPERTLLFDAASGTRLGR